MPALPIISGRSAGRAFEKLGWQFDRQRGSPMILVKTGYPATLSIPDHREIARDTLRSLIRFAGLRIEEFISAL